jgi:WD40 repeat protein
MPYKPLLTLRGHTKSVYSVAFADLSRRYLASGSYDSTVKLWDLAAGQEVSTIHGHAGSVSSVAFSPHSCWLATGSNDHRVKLWWLAIRRRLWLGLRTGLRLGVEAHSGAVYSVAFTPDERWLISGGTDHTVRLIDLAARTTPITLHDHSGHVYQVAVSPRGRWLASASMDNSVALWDLPAVLARRTELPLVVLRSHTDGVTSVAFSPDGRWLASGSYDNTIKLWDLSFLPRDLTTLRYPAPLSLRAHGDCVQSVTFSPDSRRLASASSDSTVKVWDITARPGVLATLRKHTDNVFTAAFSPDGLRLASGSKDNTVIIWDVAS